MSEEKRIVFAVPGGIAGVALGEKIMEIMELMNVAMRDSINRILCDEEEKRKKRRYVFDLHPTRKMGQHHALRKRRMPNNCKGANRKKKVGR